MTSVLDIADVVCGSPFPSSGFREGLDPQGLPVVRIRDVVPGRSSNTYIGPYESTYLVNDGDMLIGMDGEFNLVRWRGGRALLNQRVCKLIQRPNKVNARYLFWVLLKELKAIEERTPFVTVKHLSAKAIAAIDIDLPPLADQRRIADILDADTIRRKRREAIALTEELLRSAFLEMFGDPVGNPKGWPVSPLPDLCESKQYGTAEKANSDGHGMPVLRMNNLTYARELDLTSLEWVALPAAEAEKLDLRDGDVLFNRVRVSYREGAKDTGALFDSLVQRAFSGSLSS